MQINITARHLKLTSAINDYARKKIAKAQKYYDGEDMKAHVILKLEKNRQIADLSVNIGKIIFRAKEQSSDIYAAIDLAMDKLEKQLRKQKEISKIHRKSNISAAKEKKKAADAIYSYDETDDSRKKISEIKRFDLRIISVKQAIEDMSVFDYNVYMFLNRDTKNVNVLYREGKAGSLILLEPEI